MSKTTTEATPEIRINIDELPEQTRKYILALSAQENISPNDAALIVLNFAATEQNTNTSVPTFPAHFPN